MYILYKSLNTYIWNTNYKQGKLPIVKTHNEQSDRCLNNDSIAKQCRSHDVEISPKSL